MPLIVIVCLLATPAVSCSGKGTARQGARRESPAPAPTAPDLPTAGGAVQGGQDPTSGQDASTPVLQMRSAGEGLPDSGPAAKGKAPSPVDPGNGAALPASPAAQAAQEPALPSAILAERGFGLAAPFGPLLPEDSRIGPLQDWRSGNEAEREALKAAAAFLDGLVAGHLSEDLVAPGRLPMVSMLTRDILAGPRPEAYRIGVLQSAGAPGDGTTTARICLAYPAAAPGGPGPSALAETAAPSGKGGERGWVTGEIGLRRIKGIWYIESVTFADAPS